MLNNLNKPLGILLSSVLIINFSCNEEFLDINANQITVDAISKEQAIELVNGTYNIFLTWQVSSFSWNAISSIASDDADKGVTKEIQVLTNIYLIF